MTIQIIPTVGRIVLCYDASRKIDGLPGLIIHVWGDKVDSLVNVSIQGDGANEPFNQSLTSVRVLSPDEPKPAGPYCTWIPHQVGQAARTEQVGAFVRELQVAPAEFVRSNSELAKAATEALNEIRDLIRLINGVGLAIKDETTPAKLAELIAALR